MATKKEVQKRRVQARQRADAQAVAAGRKDRRRRMVVGAVAGTLAVAMVASLGVGFLAATDDPDVDDPTVDFEDTPQPVQIVYPEPGATLSGDTPCPATDGTQERTTQFEAAPPICIDTEAGYEVSLITSEGEVIVSVDTTDVAAANLFVANSRYGVYDSVPFKFVVEEGFALTGDAGSGNTGVTSPANEAARAYQPGDVIMWADETGGISSQFAIITSDLIATELNSGAVHPIVGSVTSGTGVIESIVEVAGGPGGTGPFADVRISAATVTETT